MEPTLAAKVVEAGELQEEVKALTDKIEKSANGKKLKLKKAALAKLMDELKTEVAEDLDGNEGCTVEGGPFKYEMGIAANNTEIKSKKRLVEYLQGLGEKEFLSMVSFKITEMREYLPGPFFKQITKTERTGTRRVKLYRWSEDEE